VRRETVGAEGKLRNFGTGGDARDVIEVGRVLKDCNTFDCDGVGGLASDLLEPQTIPPNSL
jgi:hypothetical protein